MPTAARLTAAICFGALGLAFAYMSAQYFAEARQPSYWYPLSGGVGLLAGWIVVGSRVGRGYTAGMANGITGGVTVLFWVFFLMSFADMIQKSMRNAYDGPVEAVVGVFEIMGEYALQFAYIELGVLMFVGSIVGGYITEFVGRRWS